MMDHMVSLGIAFAAVYATQHARMHAGAVLKNHSCRLMSTRLQSATAARQPAFTLGAQFGNRSDIGIALAASVDNTIGLQAVSSSLHAAINMLIRVAVCFANTSWSNATTSLREVRPRTFTLFCLGTTRMIGASSPVHLA
jgi:hypothetical protein